ncbi:aspartyl/asparaginyl beta-hydroxylase domain-containing protein [Pelagibacteraceae bacterium]|nr:aspartyl/asparaginyl beta-hydroxylase domain-containing protein [Pelagibacteraceae bacterium]
MKTDSKNVINLNLKREQKFLNFNDFQKQNLNFDISKLQKAYKEIIKIKKFETAGGVSHFGAICLTRVPGDPESIKGNKARGLYWTKPDKSGNEVSRDVAVDESSYTELVPEFKNTYFKEVIEVLSSKYKLGRIRILLKEPRSTLSWHRDPEPRLHIPIITNPGCLMVIENVAKHMPADGSVWITNNTKYHNAFNGGEENRVHLVACVLDYNFD